MRFVFLPIILLVSCSEGEFTGGNKKQESPRRLDGMASSTPSLQGKKIEEVKWEGCCPYHLEIEESSGSDKKILEKKNGLVGAYTRIKPFAFHSQNGSQVKVMKIAAQFYRDASCKTLISEEYAKKNKLPDPKSSLPITSSVRKLTVSDDGKTAKGEQERKDTRSGDTHWEPVTYEILEDGLVETVSGDASKYGAKAKYTFTTECRLRIFKPTKPAEE